jgi:phytoene/squalene synthetase
MEFECARARGYYRLAAGHLAEEDRPTMTAAVTMGKIYYRLLEQIENLDYDVFNNRIRLHRPERFLIALSEWAKASGRGEGETRRQGEGETRGGGERGSYGE